MSNIFGKSSSRSDSGNQNLGLVNNIYAHTGYQGQLAGQNMANMLGLYGPQAQNDGFNTWKQGTGYQFGLDQGVKSITGNAATQGLLNSGATAKALNTYGQNYADTQYGNYWGQLNNLLSGGLQAGNILANVGQYKTEQGAGSNGGAGGMIASGLGTLFAK